MAIHPDFPLSPYEILNPRHRWFPAAEELRATAYEKLLPPLVANIREEVAQWRAEGYAGASATSRALLTWWFLTEHLVESADGTESEFRYYFAQREAVETVIWLYDVRRVRDKFDLLRFDASGAVSSNMFDEDWPRFVVKMATGAGKTKVLSLLMAWSYFHRLYEEGSTLARNFLLIAPNIIVLDRLRHDFDGLRIFFNDPVLPDNGHAGHNWRDDFQVALHIQDDVRIVRPTGNIFLTNIHRVYLSDVPEPSLEDDDLRDYFLAPFGNKPVGKTNDSNVDLGEVVREIDELAVFNDEAHHIHDNRLAWFQCIQDIHHRLLQKDLRLTIQVDVTATPRHDNGAIFVQTVSDYPLVEAIAQNVVKHPVLPDMVSRAKLTEHKSPIITEKYADYLQLGVEEWRKSYAEHERLGKKAVLFVMVDDTKNCDEVGAYLQKICPELQDSVLVIHTKANGEISEAASGKSNDELELLRRESNEIDTWKSPHKAIVSVLMLKEGWDVRNVTVIVGLRAYAAKSNILPEQTLGRGLRRMYFGSDQRETVSVMGTPAFMEFVESIQNEGVTFDRVPMGGAGGRERQDSIVVEVDTESPDKNIDELDISVPRLTRRYNREFKDLTELEPEHFGNPKLPVKPFTPEQTREIVFKTMLDSEVDHTIQLDGTGPGDYRSVIAFFARQLLKDLRLVGGYDQLYPKVKSFIRDYLFTSAVDLDDPVILRNLSEPEVAKVLFDHFRAAINTLTIYEGGTSRIDGHIRLRDTRPFRTEPRGFLPAKKSVFNRSGFGGNEGTQAQDGFFHGARNGRLVVIGPINLPVGRLFVEEVITECRKRGASRADILAFEFEMGLFPAVLEEARSKGIDLAPKYIPAEVFDKRAVEKGQVVFHDVSFVEATPRYDKKNKRAVCIELTDFSVYYTQGAAEAAIAAMKEGKSEVICEQGQLYKVSKAKDGIVQKERLTKLWTDWVDYWAVDFDYMSRKEIIKVHKSLGVKEPRVTYGAGDSAVTIDPADFEERWTGGFIFENEWQSFRTRQNRDLELATASHTYERPGRYTVAVKVIDIFGNDTMTLVPVNVG